MRYWWANQKQTYRHEVPGGYLWSPKLKSNGHRNPFYEFMREVSPGDLIFSFADARIRALGIAQTPAFTAPKPEDFGSAGRNWDEIGWRVDVNFTELYSTVRPADWMELLGPLLPAKYAPLLSDGRGVQSIYLTELTEQFAMTLANLVGSEAVALARGETVGEGVPEKPDEVSLWEEHLRQGIEANHLIEETERENLVLSRRGQGLFRNRVLRLETRCRVTRVDRPEHLRASHSKPWRESSNVERLNGANGLMLSPSIDHLYDRGFISFENDGRLLVSPVAHRPSLAKMGVRVDGDLNVGGFRAAQQPFLEYHRDLVFLRARVGR